MPEAPRRIAILATGGTIAGAPTADVSYRAGSVDIDTLVQALPKDSQCLSLRGEQLSNVGSQDMDAPTWETLRRRIQELADSGQVDGCVVTHGTDTMEETAYLLNLTLDTRMPVVITGAMRPAHSPGADGPANLHAAVTVAAHSQAANRGVLAVMDDVIHGARDVQKTAAAGTGAFESPNHGTLGRVQGHDVAFHSVSCVCHTSHSQFARQALAPLIEIPVLYAHADMGAGLVRAVLDLEPRGLVLAGVGNGNASRHVLNRLAEAAATGKQVIVRASRIAKGSVTRNLEVNDDQYGFVVANDLMPAKARVLLALALEKTRNVATIQRFFDTH